MSFHVTLLHQGFVIVGLPHSFQGQMGIDEITGGSPYGASTIAGGKGDRMPSENELGAAWLQGRHVAAIAAKLAKSSSCKSPPGQRVEIHLLRGQLTSFSNPLNCNNNFSRTTAGVLPI